MATANRLRLAASELRAELTAGEVHPAEAVHDPRAATMTVLGLLMAQHQWGRARALRFLAELHDTPEIVAVRENKRIRDLSDRQRAFLTAALRRRAR